jgi:hypothetical protein
MSTSPAEFNNQIIDEFHANEGHVGGMFEGTPLLLLLHHVGAQQPRPKSRREVGEHPAECIVALCAACGTTTKDASNPQPDQAP